MAERRKIRSALVAIATAGLSLMATLDVAHAMKIRLSFNGNSITATMIDSATTRDFMSLLPLTIPMTDLFGREKTGDLPRPLADGGPRTRAYEVGDVIYWSPSAHLAIYYRHDGLSIPSPGIIVLGKAGADAVALNVPGSVTVTIERAED